MNMRLSLSVIKLKDWYELSIEMDQTSMDTDISL